MPMEPLSWRHRFDVRGLADRPSGHPPYVAAEAPVSEPALVRLPAVPGIDVLILEDDGQPA
jgi:hypothetical protein